MTSLSRGSFIAAGAASLTPPALAQEPGHQQHGGHYEPLNQPGRIGKPKLAAAQNVFDSPAPKAANPSRRTAKALLPTNGRRATRCRPPAPAMAPCSVAARSASRRQRHHPPRRLRPIMGGGVQSAVHEAFSLG